MENENGRRKMDTPAACDPICEKKIIRKKIKPKDQALKLMPAEREELRFRNSLLRFRGCLLDQMKRKFDRVLSGKLDAVDFLLTCCKKDGRR
jgi:hypothetical protein